MPLPKSEAPRVFEFFEWPGNFLGRTPGRHLVSSVVFLVFGGFSRCGVWCLVFGAFGDVFFGDLTIIKPIFWGLYS